MIINELASEFRVKLNLLRRDFFLLLDNPRDYLYTFTYSNVKKVNIYPYNHKVNKLGHSLTEKIHAKFPELSVYFLGSAKLGILGQRDIDLMASCQYKNFDTYLPYLTFLFGKPDKRRKKFVEWHFRKNRCDIELLLIDPSSHMFQSPLKIYELLNNNKRYLQEYIKIKQMSDGIPIREYNRKRMEFFNRILKESTTNKNPSLKPNLFVNILLQLKQISLH